MQRTDDVPAPMRRPLPLEMYHRLLAALEVIAVDAEGAGADGIREWAALASLDAIELGEGLGMLRDEEAKRRRQVVRGHVQDLDLGA